MKDKSKVLKTYRYMFDKLQFIGLIGRARPKHFAHNLLQA